VAPVGIDPMDMDGDSNDEVTAEALNGETKPDVAKLAQSAIIKQVSSAFHCSVPLADVHIESAVCHHATGGNSCICLNRWKI